MRRAFIFDLDGTLIDSRRTIAAACNHALAKLGRATLAEAEIAGYVGDGARNLILRALRAATKTEPAPSAIEETLAEFVCYYAAHPVDGTTWMPGAREALERLAGHELGLVTNKTRLVTEPILRALGVAHLFGAVVAGGDGPLKPDPAPIRSAMRALSGEPSSTSVVGDGVQDVRAGRAAGCRTIAVLGGFTSEARLRAEQPDLVLATLAELRVAEEYPA